MERLLTVNELAKLLNISSGTVYHWISEDRLPVVRFSKRCVRFRESDVQLLLDSLSQANHKGPAWRLTRMFNHTD
jgi:excisionase family DNA binding protein